MKTCTEVCPDTHNGATFNNTGVCELKTDLGCLDLPGVKACETIGGVEVPVSCKMDR